MCQDTHPKMQSSTYLRTTILRLRIHVGPCISPARGLARGALSRHMHLMPHWRGLASLPEVGATSQTHPHHGFSLYVKFETSGICVRGTLIRKQLSFGVKLELVKSTECVIHDNSQAFLNLGKCKETWRNGVSWKC